MLDARNLLGVCNIFVVREVGQSRDQKWYVVVRPTGISAAIRSERGLLQVLYRIGG